LHSRKRQRSEEKWKRKGSRSEEKHRRKDRRDHSESPKPLREKRSPTGKDWRGEKKQRRDEVEKDAILEGIVSKISEFGCFVALDNVGGRKEGLVHISQLS